MDLYVFFGLIVGEVSCIAATVIGSRNASRSGTLSRLQAAGQVGFNLLILATLVSLIWVIIVRLFKQNTEVWHVAFPVAAIVLSIMFMSKINRSLLAFVFGQIDEVEVCLRSLKDSLQTAERVAAAQLLGQRGDLRAIVPLERAIRDKDESVRKAAVNALTQIDDMQAVKPQRPEELRGTAREIALAVKTWSYEQTKHWWTQNPHRINDTICDACNRPIRKDDSYLLARWMRCESCMNRSLCDANWRSLLSGADRAEVIGKIRNYFDHTIPDKVFSTIL